LKVEHWHRLVAQIGAGVSIRGDIHNKPSGHGPRRPTVGGPAGALRSGLDQTTSRGPFQPQPFCDSVRANCVDMHSLDSERNPPKKTTELLGSIFTGNLFEGTGGKRRKACHPTKRQGVLKVRLAFLLFQILLQKSF